MTPGAQELLSILSMPPDGLTDADLVQAKLPIIDILACKTTLIRTSLAFVDHDQHLKVLVPVREHILTALFKTMRKTEFFSELVCLCCHLFSGQPDSTNAASYRLV
jgi:hypothetical protein